MLLQVAVGWLSHYKIKKNKQGEVEKRVNKGRVADFRAKVDWN